MEASGRTNRARRLTPLLLAWLASLAVQSPGAALAQVRTQNKDCARDSSFAARPDDPRERIQRTRRWFGPPPSKAQKAQRRKVVSAARAQSTGVVTSTANRPTWVNLGPTDQPGSPDLDSGRLSGVLVLGSTVLVSSPGGGVFRAQNARALGDVPWRWEPLTDGLDTSSSRGGVAVGAMVASPSIAGRVYLGLGDYRDSAVSGELIVMDGALGTPSFSAPVVLDSDFVLSLAVAVVDGRDQLYVGTERGLYVGRPGSLRHVSTFSEAQIWSVVTRGEQTAVVSALKDDRAILYYTENGGDQWRKASLSDELRALDPRRITVAADPTNPDKLWGLAARPDGEAVRAILMSVDGGKSWTVESSKGLEDGLQFARENQMLTVHPDGSALYFGTGGALYRSADGGKRFQQIGDDDQEDGPYLHADLHAAAWWRGADAGTTEPWVLLIGSDGGLSVLPRPKDAPPSPRKGTVPSDPTFLDNRRNFGLPLLQAYNLASSAAPGATDLVAAGSQDNGARLRATANGTLTGSSRFAKVSPCGDAFGVLLHPTDPNKMLTACDSTVTFRSTNALVAEPFFVDTSPCVAQSDRAFFTRLVAGAADASGETVYTASDSIVFRSDDFGDTWTALAGRGLPTGRDKDKREQLRQLATAPSSRNTLALLTDNYVYLSSDDGANWEKAKGSLPNSVDKQDRRAPSRSLSAVRFDPADARTFYVASNSADSRTSHLWKSSDGGKTFSAIDRRSGNSNGFPFGVAVHAIAVSPVARTFLVAGTSLGAYASGDGGRTWSRLATGLPFVEVTDLVFSPDGGLLRAATFGRGLWELQLGGAR